MYVRKGWRTIYRRASSKRQTPLLHPIALSDWWDRASAMPLERLTPQGNGEMSISYRHNKLYWNLDSERSKINSDLIQITLSLSHLEISNSPSHGINEMAIQIKWRQSEVTSRRDSRLWVLPARSIFVIFYNILCKKGENQNWLCINFIYFYIKIYTRIEMKKNRKYQNDHWYKDIFPNFYDFCITDRFYRIVKLKFYIIITKEHK